MKCMKCSYMKDKSKKGGALIYVILLLCFAVVIGTGALVLADKSMKNTAQEIKNEQAYLTAKSGLNYVVNLFADEDNNTRTMEIAKRIASIGSVANSNVLAPNNGGTFNTTLTCATNESGLMIEGDHCTLINISVTGNYDNASATLNGKVRLNPSESGAFKSPYIAMDLEHSNVNNADVRWFDYENYYKVNTEANDNKNYTSKPIEDNQVQGFYMDLFAGNSNNMDNDILNKIELFINKETSGTGRATLTSIEKELKKVGSDHLCNYNNQVKTNCIWGKSLDSNDIFPDSYFNKDNGNFIYLLPDNNGLLDLSNLNIVYNSNWSPTNYKPLFLVTDAKHIKITGNTKIGTGLFKHKGSYKAYESFNDGDYLGNACIGIVQTDPLATKKCFDRYFEVDTESKIILINIGKHGNNGQNIDKSVIEINGTQTYTSAIQSNLSLWIFAPQSDVKYGNNVANTNILSGGIIANTIYANPQSTIFGMGMGNYKCESMFKGNQNQINECNDNRDDSVLYRLLKELGVNLDANGGATNGVIWEGIYD